jgi:hypothetical protein
VPSPWDALSGNIEGQLAKPSIDDPKSPQDIYLACLAKVDQVEKTTDWFLLFDMIPCESAFLALATPFRRWPLLPTILFHATGAKDSVVRDVLSPPREGPIEGSWYALHLAPNGDPQKDLTGELYPPADEFLAQSSEEWTPRYGTWHIDAFRLIWVPDTKGPEVILREPTGNAAIYRARGSAAGTLMNGPVKRKIDALAILPIGGDGTVSRVKRRRVVPVVLPPPPPPPGFGAIGVMDIGQGGCNLLFDRTLEPIFYYDVGYPLGFFRNTVPVTMQAGNVAFTGPIFQNTAANLYVVLSHWDWDHWRLGALVAGGQTLAALPWYFPQQPMSPTAQNFVNNTLANPNQIAAGTPPQVIAAGVGANAFTYTLYKYVPPMGAFGGMLINNSGLAIRVSVDLAAGQASAMLMTGDGNFQYLPLASRAGLTGIAAVHHGSIAHGASTNLPAAPVGAPSGYIAYSYGVSSVTGNHSYGFPVAGAVANYQAAAWNAPTEMSTAEGAAINNTMPPPPQGNVRMGNQGGLPIGGGTSFGPIGHALP